MKQMLFIVNPFSGVWKNKRIEPMLEQHLDSSQFRYEVIYTEFAGHGTEIAAGAVARGVDIVVAVGGDGTINEIAKSLIHTEATLGILPAGSGNGFAMHLGYGRKIERAVSLLNTSKELTIDTGICNGDPFINLAGVGFDGLIAYRTKHNSKRGFQNYLKMTLAEARTYQFPKYQIELDGQLLEQSSLVIEIANARMFGYNFEIAPKASLTDGVFDIIVIKKAPKWKYVAHAPKFLNKSLLKSSLVDFYRAKEIKITAQGELFYHIDGEGMTAGQSVAISMIPHSLKILVPEEYG